MYFMRSVFKSVSIYISSEFISYNIDSHSVGYPNSINRVLLGTFIDSVIMRKFHKFIDIRVSSNIVKTCVEQSLISPSIGASFLLLHNNFTFSNWKDMFMDDCKYWPIASFIGYRFVSTQYRFVYVSIASIIWNNYRIYVYAT